MKALRVAVLYLAAGLIGGFALSALLSDDADKAQHIAAPDDTSLALRITQIESQLAAVIAHNAALTEALQRFDKIFGDSMPNAVPGISEHAAGTAGTEPADAIAVESQSGPRERIPQARETRGRQYNLVERLTDSGFSQSDAQHIETRIEELRVAAMQSRYDALRSGEPQSAPDQLIDESATLRAELGEADYERYLEAMGRPTRVDVTSVLSSSAAQTAGVQPGDQIVSYAGERVFDIRALNQVLLEGEPGEPVIVDIERDGQPMQLVIPRGPLGISSGFARRGNR